MADYPTPHINAKPEDFGKTVLMPGDPLRSKFIAETFLDHPVLVNNVRGVQGYTGTYKGVKVSVMASGMGMPSIGIYSYELFNFFGVENIIRVGSAGGYSDKVNLRDIIIAQASCTDSNFMSQFRLPGAFAPIADFTMLETAVNTAKELGLTHTHVGNILSSDRFYCDESFLKEDERTNVLWKKMGVLGVEMESAALYANAARAGKRALGIFTCSDHLFKNEATTAEERQTSFTDMMKLALEVAVKMEKIS